MYVKVWLNDMTVQECFHGCGPWRISLPYAHGYFYPVNIKPHPVYESTNQEWGQWPNVWMSTLLNGRYGCFTRFCLATWFKPQLDLFSVWYIRQELICQGVGFISSQVPSGVVGWTAESMPQHHELGTSWAMVYTLPDNTWEGLAWPV